MKYRSYTESEVLFKSQETVHAYFHRDMDTFTRMLDDSFIWIGSYSFHYTKGKEDFLKAAKPESEEIPAQISEEEYCLLCHEKKIWIVYGHFTASAWENEESLVYSHQRLTLVWKQVQDDLKLLHVNCTMAKDVPIEAASLPGTERLKEDIRWFDYIRRFETLKEKEEQIMLKDSNGRIHFLFPSEILSVHVESRLSTIYTGGSLFTVRKNLNHILEEIPQLLQVHKNWLVNPVHMKTIQRYTITLLPDMEVPVGKSRYNEVRDALARKNFHCQTHTAQGGYSEKYR